MRTQRIGLLSGVVGAIALLVQFVPGLVVRGWVDNNNRFPEWAPMLDTAGTTVMAYNIVLDILQPTVVLGLTLGFGYYLGTRLDLADEYRRLVKALLAGSTAGIALALVGLQLYQGMNLSQYADVFAVGGMVGNILSTLPLVVLGSLVGATIPHFRPDDDAPYQPSETDTPTPQSRSESSGSQDRQSQPTR